MKYIDEFRNLKIAEKLYRLINEEAEGLRQVNFMEVCGTHTMAVERFGIRRMLPENVRLISGPGCPVCVTPKNYIDKAIALTAIEDVIVFSFGDMLKVPGTNSSLLKQNPKGKVRVVYSALDAVLFAEKNRDKKIVFLGIGFETTAPTVAASIKYAKKKKLKNFFVYSGHKVMPPAMRLLAEDKEVNIKGFLCPAHVSAIIGIKSYADICEKYNIPCVIAGFEPLDVLQSILMLVRQVKSEKAEVENQYNRVVKASGNVRALRLIEEVFSIKDSEWRGIGVIPRSGLILSKRYAGFDIEKNIDLPEPETSIDRGCICGNVLKGIKTPPDCKLFSKKCNPDNPYGACMVSSEGACAAYYRYGAGRK
ncbi:MAG: hydrogenase formation protein HypD [Candidatus Omnitrophota bacterium]|nr:hydrogenase formation protein HypD [Candidatus Omnitrophota bacterium]